MPGTESESKLSGVTRLGRCKLVADYSFFVITERLPEKEANPEDSKVEK